MPLLNKPIIFGRVWHPRSVADCRLALFADVNSYAETTRLTRVVDDGAAVAGVLDISGCGNHASQSSATLQPLYKTSIFGDKPAWLFDGSNDVLTADALASVFSGTSKPFTLFVVLKHVATTATQYVASFSNSGNTVRHQFRGDSTSWRSVRRDDSGTATDVNQANADPPDTTYPHILTYVYDGTNVTFSLDSADIKTQAQLSATCTLDQFRIGGYTGSSPGYFHGYIGSILLYSRALSQAERRRIERWLGEKFTIPIAVDGVRYVDSVNGNSAYSGKTKAKPKSNLASPFAALTSSGGTIYCHAPETTPFRETVQHTGAGAISVQPYPEDDYFYHYPSEKITGAWTSVGGGIYSHTVVTNIADIGCVVATDMDGFWPGQHLMLKRTTNAEDAPDEGEFGWDQPTKTVYIHLAGGEDPVTHTFETGKYATGFGTIGSGQVTFSRCIWRYAASRGAQSGGLVADPRGGDLRVFDSIAEYCGGSGLGTAGHAVRAEFVRCVGRNNYNDGFNYHGDPDLGADLVQIQETDCQGYHNGDEGTSAHENQHQRITGGVYYENNGPGTTCAFDAILDIDGSEFYGNNTAWWTALSTPAEGGGVTYRDATNSGSIANAYIHDDPLAGLYIKSGAQVTVGSNRSGTEHGNASPDNLAA